MLMEQQVTLELLFEQLGLPSDEASIEQFVKDHQLDAKVALPDAEFWSEGQSAFLREHWHQDDEWIVIIDKLNQLLHVESDKAAE
ncbi:DUF2789 domain-containing protein [Acinetobacter bohemicus]|uniref:DUF2789 domain-containing protein n=1 Tax=Acinetobacter lwoffii TaxID=28090 RepID=A0A9D2UUE1_ACILW|nr:MULTISPECIES: DUF2789 family protein [unclassified Acinetobacter]MCO8045659.1 DUF2789 domain-containing protein [Acinetobacter sp. S4397-1]MDM1782645.1 DUF2789 family protein [Acinetobacter indicus]QKQ69168.1 DUF2789 family protein [Acinetobacter sp. 10FS3-1]HJF28854.1 DUF2789 domain-containing protein [Acinetobacter lwoffii]